MEFLFVGILLCPGVFTKLSPNNNYSENYDLPKNPKFRYYQIILCQNTLDHQNYTLITWTKLYGPQDLQIHTNAIYIPNSEINSDNNIYIYECSLSNGKKKLQITRITFAIKKCTSTCLKFVKIFNETKHLSIEVVNLKRSSLDDATSESVKVKEPILEHYNPLYYLIAVLISIVLAIILFIVYLCCCKPDVVSYQKIHKDIVIKKKGCEGGKCEEVVGSEKASKYLERNGRNIVFTDPKCPCHSPHAQNVDGEPHYGGAGSHYNVHKLQDPNKVFSIPGQIQKSLLDIPPTKLFPMNSMPMNSSETSCKYNHTTRYLKKNTPFESQIKSKTSKANESEMRRCQSCNTQFAPTLKWDGSEFREFRSVSEMGEEHQSGMTQTKSFPIKNKCPHVAGPGLQSAGTFEQSRGTVTNVQSSTQLSQHQKEAGGASTDNLCPSCQGHGGTVTNSIFPSMAPGLNDAKCQFHVFPYPVHERKKMKMNIASQSTTQGYSSCPSMKPVFSFNPLSNVSHMTNQY